MKRIIVIEISSILFMILFLYTGINKWMEYSVFKSQISESPMLAPVAPLIASLLPLVEIVVSIFLLIPRWRLMALYASLILMIVFTIYVIALLSFSTQLPCSCGGVLQNLTWPQHIVFNIAFTALAITAIVLGKKQTTRGIV